MPTCFRFFLSGFALGFTLSPLQAEAGGWRSLRLTSEFFAEGAGAGDINGDGKTDLVYGPRWWAGPDFTKVHRFAPGEPFVGERGYSDNFFCFVLDANGDGRQDILVYGFPGKEVRLYLNPGKPEENAAWAMHLVAGEISNESPAFVDIIPGGLPEMVCTRENAYGFYEAGADATQPWTWREISEKGAAGGRFEHGLGVGDINGDGRLDIVQRESWFEHPAEARRAPWTKHRWSVPAQSGGAQILVDDVDGDGDSDIITSLRAHGYGLAWFEQFETGKFQPHPIMGESSLENPYGVCFSQLHALALADIDGDGRKDFVTGKRYLAHQGHDPGALMAPVVYWFRNVKTGNEIEFVPHFVDDDSGVGVEVKVVDVNGDGRPDIISGNKKGLAVHLNEEDRIATAELKWKVPGGRPQEGYGSKLNPREALAKMEAPEGFSVDLIAAEPEITQPIAMCFDDRGRIWVIEGKTYPARAPEGEGKDRILIFEDGDGDGSFETRKVFVEGINLASGIEVGFGGVYVGAAPYLLFFPDRNGDDRPDGEAEVLLDGWGYQDTHETLNAFVWGPDGWLYGCHGVFTHSRVGKPGTPDAERIPINAGVWRFHPVTRDFQVYAHGTSNPWGVDFNETGDFFVSACVIPHFYHLSRGGRYQRQAGQHFNAWTFDDIKTIADHAHYTGNIRDHAFWGAKPVAPSDTSALGGGHAHCGLAIYNAPEFPESYRGGAFFHNLHGHRMVREKLETHGSGYIARHRPDFVLSHNHDYVGVGVMQGPDGSLYFADWADAQTCHHRDVAIWNRENGRIFRVRYGAVKPAKLDLPSLGDTDLASRLADPHSLIARRAQRLLQERAAAGKIDRTAVETALARMEKDHAGETAMLLRALWTRQVIGLLDENRLRAALADGNEFVRGWAVEFCGPKPEFLTRLEEMAANDDSLVVRRYLASKLQDLPLDSRWIIAEKLVSHARSAQDPNLPLLCWYGIEPLVEHDSRRAFALGAKAAWPPIQDYIARRAVVTPAGREATLTSLSKARDAAEYGNNAKALLDALSAMPRVDPPANWAAAKARGEELAKSAPALLDFIARLGTRFGDASFFPKWRELAGDATKPPAARNEALALLLSGNDPELGPLARAALKVPELRAKALAALRAHPGKETAAAVVPVLGQLPLDLRNEAINLLASRPEMALELLRAVDTKAVSSSLVSPVLLDQFDRFKNPEISGLIAKNWTRGASGTSPEELRQNIEKWKARLGPGVLAKADASRGREVFQVTCGTCHQLFGEGIALGPDLTGSNRADLGYLLENVLAPSSVVAKEYLLHVFSLKDGSTVSGMVRRETPDFLQIAMPGGATLDVKKADLASRQELPQSLMPPGLLDALPLEQAANLVKYLGGARQEPLPSEKATAEARINSSVPPPAPGVIRIEGESLVSGLKPSGGGVQAQAMRGFGPGWSGNKHLWWTGARPGAVLSLKIPDLKPGKRRVDLYLTTARDYAKIQVAINGQMQEADLYTEKVLPREALRFEGVNLAPGQALQIDIHITGKNEAAVPGYMAGVDRIEVSE